MFTKTILVVASLLYLTQIAESGGGGTHHKKVIIHVPYKVKTIHHTHTVYKHVHDKGHGDDHEYYKVIGYSGGLDEGKELNHHEGGSSGGHDFGHSYGGGFGGGHADEEQGKDVHGGGVGGGDASSGGSYESQDFGHSFSGGYGGDSSASGHYSAASNEYGSDSSSSSGYSAGFSGGYGGGYGGGDVKSYNDHDSYSAGDAGSSYGDALNYGSSSSSDHQGGGGGGYSSSSSGGSYETHEGGSHGGY